VAARKKPAAKAPSAPESLSERGGSVVGWFGAFNVRVLIELPAAAAVEAFGSLDGAPRALVSDGVDRDIAEIAARDERIAGSALAGSARALALELDSPGNSATSKAMCARALTETLDRLRALAPPETKDDAVDDLAARRSARLAGRADPAPASRP